MIAAVLYIGAGVFAAGMAVLIGILFVHALEVRTGTREPKSAVLLPFAETRSDKERLHAEFAMSMRRLETKVDQLKDQNQTPARGARG